MQGKVADMYTTMNACRAYVYAVARPATGARPPARTPPAAFSMRRRRRRRSRWMRSSARRQRLHQRLSDRPAAARRQALRDRCRHLGNPPHADRPRAVRRDGLRRILPSLTSRQRAVRGLQRQRGHMQAQVDALTSWRSPLRGGGERRGSGMRARQAAAARAGRRAARPRIRRFSRSGSSPPTRSTATTGARAGVDRRRRPGQRPRVHDRRQRRHREGRHLLPADGEEASARPGDRRAEPPAVHLPGGLRRRQPAQPGRGVSRPRSFRPDLLQPGQHVRQGIPQIAVVMGSCTAGGAYVPAMATRPSS
jgi:hypothetical protein